MDSATKDVGDISRFIFEDFRSCSLRRMRPAISRNAWYCFVNRLLSAGEEDSPLLPLTAWPFDVLPTLEADEPSLESIDLLFLGELFFTNKFQNRVVSGGYLYKEQKPSPVNK